MSTNPEKQQNLGQATPVKSSPIQTGLSSRKIQAVERNPVCVVITKPILSGQSESTDVYPVTKVTFTVTSNDQGWSNENNFIGEYEGSWTWFEVAILRPINGETQPPIDHEPCIQKYLADNRTKERYQLLIPDTKPKSGPFWHLQRNRRAKEGAQEHTVEWKTDAVESETERLGWEFDPKNGQGSGVGFVKSLQKGDRIALVARAKQSGWVNHVSGATVQISFAGLEPEVSTWGGSPATISINLGKDAIGAHPPPSLFSAPAGAATQPASQSTRTEQSQGQPPANTAAVGNRAVTTSETASSKADATPSRESSSLPKRGPFQNFKRKSESVLPPQQPTPQPSGLVSRGWNSIVSRVKSLRKSSMDTTSSSRRTDNL